MRVVYERPTIDTKFDVFHDYNFLRVGSSEDVKRMQESLFGITDRAADFLRGYQLPDGIDGESSVIYRGL